MKKLSVCLSVCLSTISSANATPINSQSLIFLGQSEYLAQDVELTTDTASSLNNSFPSLQGSDIQGYADLSTGKTGNRIITNSLSAARQQILMFDTLTFTTPNGLPTDVSYELKLDGLMANSIQSGFYGVAFSNAITIFDITNSGNTWIEEHISNTGLDTYYSLAPKVSFVQNRVSIGTEDWFNAMASVPAPYAYDQNINDTSGALHSADITKNDTFTVDPTRIYGIRLGFYGFIRGIGTGDFLNTSTFQFTDLNGATFKSGSGYFLKGTTSTVPEPGAFFLLSIGLIGMFARSKSKS